MQVLMVTSEWPTVEHPEYVPFIVQQVHYLRRAGVEVDVFAFRGNKQAFNYLKAWLRLRRLLETKHYNLIHAQWGQSGLLGLHAGLPLVVTYHGSELQGIVGSNGCYTAKGIELQILSCYVAKHADEIVVVSEHLAKYLPAGLPFHVIPCGINLNLFRPIPQSEARRRLCLPPDKRLVLFAANPCRTVKRHYLACQAVELLKEQFDVELVTIADVAHELVPLYMNACDVLVLTSKHEGSPTVVKEALACRLPIVSVNVGDVAERIQNIEGCYICDNDSPTTIAKWLAQVLQNQNRICSCHSTAGLDERVKVQQLIKVYQSALTKKHNSLTRYGAVHHASHAKR